MCTVLALVLAGCRSAEPDLEALGWEEDWTAVGDVLAAEGVEGFDVREDLDAMAASGLWYLTWTWGEGEAIKNEDGKDATLYDAQIYLLVEECENSSESLAALASWENRERQSYDCSESVSETYAGRSFTLMTVTAREDGPYSRGAVALTTLGPYAVSVELMCREEFEGDESSIMGDFLSGLHFNETYEKEE